MIVRVLSIIAVLTVLNAASVAFAQGGGGTGGGTQGGGTTGTSQTQTGSNTNTNTGTITVGGELSTGLLNAGGTSVMDGTFQSNATQGTFAGDRSATQSFLGLSTTGNAQQQRSNNRSQFSALQNRGNNFQSQTGRGNQSRSTRIPVRHQIRMAFTFPATPVQQIQNNLQASVLALPQLSYSDSSIDLTVDDQGMATMSGTVNSERESKLLEAYVRMEPGIRKVTNQLSVQSAD